MPGVLPRAPVPGVQLERGGHEEQRRRPQQRPAELRRPLHHVAPRLGVARGLATRRHGRARLQRGESHRVSRIK